MQLICYYVYFLLLPFYTVVLLEIKTISIRMVFSFFPRLSLLFWFLVFLSGEFLALYEACYFNTTSIAFVEIKCFKNLRLHVPC